MKEYILRSPTGSPFFDNDSSDWRQHQASPRQLKTLIFFGVRPPKTLKRGQAGMIIGRIFQDERKREQWDKYVYLTKDTGQAEGLSPFNFSDLEKIKLPPGWEKEVFGAKYSSDNYDRDRRELAEMAEFAAKLWESGSQFDDGMIDIEFEGRVFCLTGDFVTGTKAHCRDLIIARGGAIDKAVTRNTDYVIMGGLGSERYSAGAYGRKVEKALFLRAQRNMPFLITESYWINSIAEDN